jgi:acetyltransferase-like isoleucine patch superfamily enzyme
MDSPATGDVTKVRAALQGGGLGGFRRYREVAYGPTSLGHVLAAEALATVIGPLPGAAGLFLRSRLYPLLFGLCGHNVLIGRNVTFRHMKKIVLGSRVVIDDNCVIDAKGVGNRGITLGDDVFVGRNTIVYCKGGDIQLHRGVSLSSNCTLFSSNSLTIEEDTVVGGYSYLLSGGEYDYRDPTPFAEQDGKRTKGPLVIGRNCWIGAHVTVLDAASVGAHSVIGAGAVVTHPVPADSLAVGVPARVVRSIGAAGPGG